MAGTGLAALFMVSLWQPIENSIIWTFPYFDMGTNIFLLLLLLFLSFLPLQLLLFSPSPFKQCININSCCYFNFFIAFFLFFFISFFFFLMFLFYICFSIYFHFVYFLFYILNSLFNTTKIELFNFYCSMGSKIWCFHIW